MTCLGALGVVLGLREHPDKYFCSEWCYNAIFLGVQGYRFSPNQLVSIIVDLQMYERLKIK